MVLEILNEYYAKIAEKEIKKKKNPIFNDKKLETSQGNYSLKEEGTSLGSFAIHEITVYQIYQAIQKLPNKASRGDHGITAKELKH